MSLMDDIFDLRDALRGRPEAEALERLENALADAEEDLEDASRYRKLFRDATKLLGEEKGR